MKIYYLIPPLIDIAHNFTLQFSWFLKEILRARRFEYSTFFPEPIAGKEGSGKNSHLGDPSQCASGIHQIETEELLRASNQFRNDISMPLGA